MRVETAGSLGPLFRITSNGHAHGTHVFAPGGKDPLPGIRSVALYIDANDGVMRATIEVLAEADAEFVANLRRLGLEVDDDGDLHVDAPGPTRKPTPGKQEATVPEAAGPAMTEPAPPSTVHLTANPNASASATTR